jgi:hypothetical protein
MILDRLPKNFSRPINNSTGAMRDEHYWNSDYSGTEGFMELLIYWYRCSEFRFGNKFLAQKFAVLNAWEVDLIPRNIVTKVQLSLSTYDLYETIQNDLINTHSSLASTVSSSFDPIPSST